MYDFIWSMNSVISSNDANHMNSSYTAIDEFIYYVTVKCEFILKITLTWIQKTSEFTWLIEYCTKKLISFNVCIHVTNEFSDFIWWRESYEFIYHHNRWIHVLFYCQMWIHLENHTHVNSDNKWIHLIDRILYKER